MDGFNVGQGVSNSTSGKRTAKIWSLKEDKALVASLVELVNIKGWKQDNGQFRFGYQIELERLMRENIPNCQMRAQPHIDSRVKILRKQYHAIAEMRGPRCSGFGWDDEDKCITCDDEVWENWIKSHPSAAGLRKKPFPFYDELDYVYGKDRATGVAAENPADAAEDLEHEEQENQSPYESCPPFVNKRDIGIEQEETSPDTPNICFQSIHTAQATPSVSGRKRKRIDNVNMMQEISAQMGNAIELMAKAGEHIGKLANCFKHESKGVDRRMAVNAEVMKVEGLTQNEIIKVGRKIALDSMETDYFFSLPEDFRNAYILSLLLPD